MIKDIISANERVTLNGKEMSVLRENFPACFRADGSFDITRFSEFLKDKIDISHEGYELKFLGKNYAKMLASLDTETVIGMTNKNNQAKRKEIQKQFDKQERIKQKRKRKISWIFKIIMKKAKMKLMK